MDRKDYDEYRDCMTNLKLSTSVDCTDEFIKCREYLSQADLIFTYKNSKDTDTENALYGITIRAHNNYTVSVENGVVGNLDLFIVELCTKDYSVIYPHVPRTYLEIELYEILQDFKVPDDVLRTYKQIIKDLEE